MACCSSCSCSNIWRSFSAYKPRLTHCVGWVLSGQNVRRRATEAGVAKTPAEERTKRNGSTSSSALRCCGTQSRLMFVQFLCLSVCLSISVSLSLSVSVSLSLSVSVCLSVSALSQSVSISMSACLPQCMPVSMPVCLFLSPVTRNNKVCQTEQILC